MANLSITNTFTAGTTIVASEVNTNFTDVSSYINARNGGSTDWDFVSSAGLITAKDGVRSSDETAATPAYSFTSETGTGMFRVTTNTLGFSTNGAQRMEIDASGNMGLGTDAPDGRLHVLTGSAGTVSADADGDELVIEGSGTTGISFLSPNASTQNIFFGDEADNNTGFIRYDHTGNDLIFGTSNFGGVTIDDNSTLLVGGTFTPSAGNSVYIETASAGTPPTFNTGADDLIIENSAGGGLTIFTPAATVAKIAFARPTQPQRGRLEYDHSSDAFSVFTGNTETFKADDDSTAGQTRVLVYDNDNATLERVSVGVADSGGSGFKVLRIPN